jgi:uncharacterized repeat protein (TIGR02543 family)
MEQNKNKKFFLIFSLLLILSLTFAFSGCVPPVPEVIDVTGVDITEEDQSLRVDKTLQLTALVTPEDATNKAIAWESDNPDVASVDENGMVTSLKRGIANITVTSVDGSFTDTIKITVIKPTPIPTPTTDKYALTTAVSPVNIGTTTGDGKYKEGDEVSISATPADGYEFVNWTDDDDGNAFVSTDNPYTFNMPEDEVNFTANFATAAGCFVFDIGSRMIISYSCINKDVIIPSMIEGSPVEKINDDTFFMNNLTSVTIPDSVTQLGFAAFAINNLTSITLSNSLSMISIQAFQRNNLTSVTIPDSVTSIGSNAFFDNNLTSITIGSNVYIDPDPDLLYTMGTNTGFRAVYDNEGKAAGTYNYDGSQWVKQ